MASAAGDGASVENARTGSCQVLFDAVDGDAECPVNERPGLGPGTAPLALTIIEQMDTTTVLPPGRRMICDERRNSVLRVDKARPIHDVWPRSETSSEEER